VWLEAGSVKMALSRPAHTPPTQTIRRHIDRFVLNVEFEKAMDKTLTSPNNLSLPWVSIWVRPRRTIRQIVDHNPSQSVYLLSALTGVYRFLNQAAKQSVGDYMSLLEILVLAILVGSLIGIFLVFVGAELFRWVGNKLDGKASAVQVRAAIAWSSVPEVVLLLLFCPLIILYGRDYFSSSIDWITPMIVLLILSVGLLGLVLLIWRVVLFINCLAEVHEFSFWKGLLTVVLGLFIVVIPLGLLLMGKLWLPRLFPS
jgi:hypothetical protein